MINAYDEINQEIGLSYNKKCAYFLDIL